MPVEFDPAWEYFSPSEEDDEGEKPVPVLARLPWRDKESGRGRRADGFGVTNSTGWRWTWMSNKPPEFKSENAEPRRCKNPDCRVTFLPKWTTSPQVFCEPDCRVRYFADRKSTHCGWCGQFFRQVRRDQRFCGRMCAGRHRRVYGEDSRVCRACEEDFTPTREGQRYCTRRCWGLEKKKVGCCPGCGKGFRVWRHGRKRKHCSARCYHPAGRKRVWDTSLRTCRCGKRFEPNSKGQTCCSRRCGAGKPRGSKFDITKLTEMSAAGLSTENMVIAVGAANVGVVRKLLRRSGVPPRPVGNRTRPVPVGTCPQCRHRFRRLKTDQCSCSKSCSNILRHRGRMDTPFRPGDDVLVYSPDTTLHGLHGKVVQTVDDDRRGKVVEVLHRSFRPGPQGGGGAVEDVLLRVDQKDLALVCQVQYFRPEEAEKVVAVPTPTRKVPRVVKTETKPEPSERPQLREMTGRARKGTLPMSATEARDAGFTGDVCGSCGGSRMRRNGACLLCEDCQTSSGCS